VPSIAGSRTNTGGTAFAPYTVSLASSANVTEPNHVLDQGFTYKATEWWSIFGDYRYSHFTEDASAQFRSVAGTVVSRTAPNPNRAAAVKVARLIELSPPDRYWAAATGTSITMLP